MRIQYSGEKRVEAKYRLSLTANQIAYLAELVHADTRFETTGTREDLAAYLNIFLAKLQYGKVNVAYVATPRKSIEQKLGLTSRSEIYEKWKAGAECSEWELGQVAAYRYTNDLMTPEEEAEYERGVE